MPIYATLKREGGINLLLVKLKNPSDKRVSLSGTDHEDNVTPLLYKK